MLPLLLPPPPLTMVFSINALSRPKAQTCLVAVIRVRRQNNHLLRRRSCIALHVILPFSSQQRKTTKPGAGHLEEEDQQLQPPAEEELSQVGGDKGRPIIGFANAMFN